VDQPLLIEIDHAQALGGNLSWLLLGGRTWRAAWLPFPPSRYRGATNWPPQNGSGQRSRLRWQHPAQPALAIQRMLNTIIDCDDKTLEKRLQDELNAVPNCLDSPDSSAGMAAFL